MRDKTTACDGFMAFADAVVSASAAAVRDWYDLSETRCRCGHSLICQHAWLNDGLCLCVRCYREHKNPAQYAVKPAGDMTPLLDTLPADHAPDAAAYPYGSGICYKPPVRPLPVGCYVCRAGWGPCACGAKIGTIGYRAIDAGPVVCETCAGLTEAGCRKSLKGKKK